MANRDLADVLGHPPDRRAGGRKEGRVAGTQAALAARFIGDEDLAGKEKTSQERI
jgi:hypothetical protein